MPRIAAFSNMHTSHLCLLTADYVTNSHYSRIPYANGGRRNNGYNSIQNSYCCFVVVTVVLTCFGLFDLYEILKPFFVGYFIFGCILEP